MKKLRKRILDLTVILIITIPLFEFGCWILLKTNIVVFEAPDYDYNLPTEPGYADINPYWGVWHAKKEIPVKKNCFELTYHINSSGARDKERSRNAASQRTIVLGDSFIEGVGVENKDRFSDILEYTTQKEFLNFGTSGNFSPTQYYLVYKHLAKEFTHNTILIGILPDNDFIDDDYEIAKVLRGNRYRPYWIGKYPDYQLKYYVDSLNKSEGSLYYFQKITKGPKVKIREFIKSYSNAFNAYLYTMAQLDYKKNVTYYENRKKNLKAAHNFDTYAGYFDYAPEQMDRLKFSIEKIQEEAGVDKHIIIFTIPRHHDFQRYLQEQKSPIAYDLGEFCKAKNITYIDLLPEMLNKNKNWESFFHTCDGHWSIVGNQTAAQVLLEKNIF